MLGSISGGATVYGNHQIRPTLVMSSILDWVPGVHNFQISALVTAFRRHLCSFRFLLRRVFEFKGFGVFGVWCFGLFEGLESPYPSNVSRISICHAWMRSPSV